MPQEQSRYFEKLDFLFRKRSRDWTRIGKNANVRGVPLIENKGQIIVGENLRLSCVPVRTFFSADLNASIEVGDNASIAHGCEVCASTSIQIGNNCRLGAFVMIIDSDYHVPGKSEALAQTSPVKIGNSVYIGSMVTILRGARIGDGAVICDGSVVSGFVNLGEIITGHYRGRAPKL
jgi:acetyltransferase-like isoleucine patch superfamily enzyme